jgi:phage gp36-like protein
MAYSAKTDMISLFGETEIIQLTDRDSLGVIDDVILSRAILSADGEIDSYIGAVYELPLPSVSDMLVTASCNITRFRLYSSRATEEVKIRYDDTIRWLRDVSRGIATLGLKITDDQPTNNLVVVSTRTQIFTDDIFSKMDLT